MPDSTQQFDQLPQAEKIKLITQNAPHLLSSLKKDVAQLNAQELANLFGVSQLEVTAKEATQKLNTDLSNFMTNFSSSIDSIVNGAGLTPGEQALLKNNFSKPLIFAVNVAATSMHASFKEGNGLLYTTLLSEKTITILEGILDFKKAIDTAFPGLTDTLISTAITGLVSAYSPPLAVLLKSTGVTSKITDLLSTESLDKTINNMYASLDKVREDKALSKMHQVGTIAAEVAKQIGTLPSTLEKFNLTVESATEMAKEVSKNVSSKEFLTTLAEYAANNIPSSEKEIDTKMAAVRESTLTALKKSGVSDELIGKATEALDKNIEKAKTEMKKCLDKEITIIDKVGHVMMAANTLSKAGDHLAAIGRSDPALATVFKECAAKLKDEVGNNVRGNVSELASKMTANSPAKEFAKKTLGAGLANEILIKRADPQQVRESSRGA
jgi:malonyl CoA-acyl carrier protein transacylase